MSADRTPRVVVAGGGIAGLAAAVSMARAGCDVVVLERAPQLRESGAGLAVTRNGASAAAALGVADTVSELGIHVSKARYVDVQGRPLLELAGEAALIGIHRRTLHGLLLSSLPPNARVRPGCTVTSVRPGADATPAVLRYTHAGREFAETADLVVAADGVGSVIREQLFPSHPPVYSGRTCWRGVVPGATTDDGFTAALGPGAEFGVLPVAAGRAYWYGYVQAPPGAVLPDEHATLQRYFASWGGVVPQVLAAVRPAELMRHDVFVQRRALPSYVQGRVVLIGDAAHSMAPTMGQGANTALEDAASLGPVLGSALAAGGPLPAALKRFDRLRRPRTGRIVRDADRMDSVGAGVVRPVPTALRNAAMRRLPVGLAASRQDRLLGWRAPDAARET